MALRLNYVARETGTNLYRNVTLTLASVVTVAVSLALVGFALLFRQAVENATDRWKGGIEFIVFIQPTATDEQRLAVQTELENNSLVNEVHYVDQEAAYAEFKDLFANSPDLVSSVTPQVLPPSYRIVPAVSDADTIQELGRQFEDRAGVREVVFAFETVRTMQRLSRFASLGILGVATFLLVAAGLLILNTIRMAMFARRREIEVMKLVGATNWFIRIPFMLEGMVQGLFGAGAAIATVLVLKAAIFDRVVSSTDSLQILQGFVVNGAEVLQTSILLLAVGLVVGAVGSAIAVTRFLDV